MSVIDINGMPISEAIDRLSHLDVAPLLDRAGYVLCFQPNARGVWIDWIRLGSTEPRA